MPPKSSLSLVNLNADLGSVFKKLNLDNKWATPDLPALEPALSTTTVKADKFPADSLALTLTAPAPVLYVRAHTRDNIIVLQVIFQSGFSHKIVAL
jgi:hypothetical protein